MKDILGNELNIGDRVAWGAGGRYGWGTRTGTVTELRPASKPGNYEYVRLTADGKRHKGGLRRADAVVRVVAPTE